MDPQNPVQIYKARNSAQAHLIASALEDEGIRAVVVEDVPVYLPATPGILVAESDAARARELVARFEQESESGTTDD